MTSVVGSQQPQIAVNYWVQRCEHKNAACALMPSMAMPTAVSVSSSGILCTHVGQDVRTLRDASEFSQTQIRLQFVHGTRQHFIADRQSFVL